MSYEVVFESLQRKRCNEMRLALYAAGMPAEVSAHSDGWQLLVEESLVEAAMAELSAYQQDKADEVSAAPNSAQCLPGGTLEGIFGFAAIVILCAYASWYSGPYAGEVGQLHAGRLLAGEWWRAATALTLHLDSMHLFSNLVFGAVFGFLAGQLLGGGVAWLLILLGGACGNFVNALVREASHQSIGASTAVFSALGIVVALALRPSLRATHRPMQRWSPLIAGVLLLAFLGTGDERVDVSAHFTGFVSGLLGGWSASHLPSHWLCNTKLQWACGLAAIGIIVLAWFAGLAIAS